MIDPLQPWQREIAEAMKAGRPILMCGGRASGKRFISSVVISEMARLRPDGITISTTEGVFNVPPGTPWQEALPVRMRE